MYTELPKLFDRNFAISYFMPVSMFFTASTWLLKSVDYWPLVRSWFTGDTLFDVTLTIFLAWMAGVLLMVLNREVIRFLEGYEHWNPLRLLLNRARRQFRKKVERVNWLNDQHRNMQLSEEMSEELTELMTELADEYPDEEDWILPTAFGNATRAFEVYPRVMYGIEGIDGWPRILTVIPKDYRALIDDAKAQVDWWINLGMMSFVFLIEFWVVIFSKWGLTLPWKYTLLNILIPLAGFLILNRFFSWRAVSSVVGWGDYIKSAFDAYRFALLDSFGIDIPTSRKAERELWNSISQSVLYRRPDRLPELKKKPGKGVIDSMNLREELSDAMAACYQGRFVMSNPQPNNPLHGITLEMIVNQLVEQYGWAELGKRIPINCFKENPSVKSSLKFLRRTPWARKKVEDLYLESIAK